MAEKIATARHGAHQSNVLTPAGQQEVDTSARWLLDLCHKDGITTVNLVCSEEPRARESGARYQAILAEGGITVNLLPCDSRLNPADGVGSIAKGDKERGIPAYGQGFVKWWGSNENKLPSDVESYTSVAIRVNEMLGEVNTEDPTELLLAVFHGGSIEPGLSDLVALNRGMDDLPSGALVVSDTDALSYEMFNPADASVISGN